MKTDFTVLQISATSANLLCNDSKPFAQMQQQHTFLQHQQSNTGLNDRHLCIQTICLC